MDADSSVAEEPIATCLRSSVTATHAFDEPSKMGALPHSGHNRFMFPLPRKRKIKELNANMRGQRKCMSKESSSVFSRGNVFQASSVIRDEWQLVGRPEKITILFCKKKKLLKVYSLTLRFIIKMVHRIHAANLAFAVRLQKKKSKFVSMCRLASKMDQKCKN